jgi:DNA-binding FrmR family transcriptional regulator
VKIAANTRGKGKTMPGHTKRSRKEPAAGGEPAFVATCGCALDDEANVAGRKAVAVDPDIRDRNLKRLRRIEGQVRGLQKMVDSDRYCADVLTQISSVHEALRAVGRELLRNHLRHCAAAAIRSDDPAEADSMYDELVDMMYRNAR